MIEFGIAPAEEVFLPYLPEPNGRMVHKIFVETRLKQLHALEVLQTDINASNLPGQQEKKHS